MKQNGLLHIYTGEGKGKTTAAIGQCIRAAGSDMQVYFVQFLKDGTSGEIEVLRKIPGVSVAYVAQNYGFYKNMTEEEKKRAKKAYGNLLDEAIETVREMAEEKGAKVLLVFDEIIGAYNHDLIVKEHLMDFLREKTFPIEVILTGREPAAELLELADYVTDMKKIKHPFDGGIQARKGIEY